MRMIQQMWRSALKPAVRASRCCSFTPKKVWNRPKPTALSSIRGFSTKDNEKKLNTTALLETYRDSSLTGLGQVIFLGSDKAGTILLVSLALGDLNVATWAAVGAFTSNITAHQLMDKPVESGLMAYNGALVGCAAAVFLPGSTALMTVTGAATATAVTACLPVMTGKMPQWTYAFNAVALSVLLRTQPLAATPSENVSTDVVTPTTTSALDLVTSPLKGLSQIFVVESSLTGLGVLVAISSWSPGLAAHALAGSAVGAAVGLASGAPFADVAAGLWSYNSALTSMGVAVFFVDSTQSRVLSATSAAATAVVFGGLSQVFGSSLGSPCLTLPFCFCMSAAWSLHASSIPGLILAADPHSPEKNKA